MLVALHVCRRPALLLIECLSNTYLILHLRISFGSILPLSKVIVTAESIRGCKKTALSRPNLMVLLRGLRLISAEAHSVKCRVYLLALVTIVPIHVEIVWHCWRRSRGSLLDLGDQLLKESVLTWVAAWVRALVILLEKGLSYVCKLAHILVVVALSSYLLMRRRNTLRLIGVLLVEYLCQRLLDCCIWILRRSTTRLLVLLKYLSVYHALNVLRKIF